MAATVDVNPITEATVADVPAIRQIALIVWPDTFGDILTPEQLETALSTSYSEAHLTQLMVSGKERFFILREDGEAVAYASISPHTEILAALPTVPETTLKNGQISSFKLEKLYCLPQSHGRGYGKQLLNHVAVEAKNKGTKTLHLLVNRQNPAVGFYQAKGFEVVGELNHMYEGILREDFVMMKDLENV